MMEDSYVEWLVKRKDPAYAIPLKALMVLVCIFSVFMALQTVLGVILMTAAFIGTYFVFINLSIEYEYLYADGGLRIDRIMGKARRKKIFDCDKEDVQFVAPADSYMLKDYESSGIKLMDCSSGRKDGKVYAMIYQKGADHKKILFEPNEKMVKAMRRAYLRRMVA